MPRVALGLPIRNGERFLAEVLDSILDQTYGDFILIISDNASTDRTEEICREYAARDPRVQYHRNHENIGAAPNFNRAFELAQPCDHVKWCAADDLLAPEYLEECVRLLEEDPRVVVAHTAVEIIDEHGQPVAGNKQMVEGTESSSPARRFRDLICLHHWCYDIFGLMRSSALATTPLIASYIASDRNLLVEMGLHGPFAHSSRELFFSRDHQGRSIRELEDIRDRGAWFDPRLRGRLVLPHFRQLWEYFRSLMRVPIGAGTRLSCTLALLDWARRFRFLLWADLRRAFLTMLRYSRR